MPPMFQPITKNILKHLRFSKNHGFFKKLFWRSFFWKLHKVYFQRNLLEKIDLKWSLKNASPCFNHKKYHWKIWGFQRTTDFSRDCFEEVFFEKSTRSFSKRLVGKNRLKMVFEKCLPCFNPKKILKNPEVFKEPRIFQETVSKKFFLKNPPGLFQKDLLEKSI